MFTIEKSINNIDQTAYRKLIESAPNTNVFQTIEMQKFWEENENHEPFFYAAIDKDNIPYVIISGVIIKEGSGLKSGLTKRAIIYGGPVICENEDSEKALSMILESINNDLKKKAIYIETRNLNDYSTYKHIFENAGWQYKPHLNFHVDCSEEAQMKKRVSKSKMRQIKKSLNSGAEIVVAENLEDVESFYKILKNLYETKVKTPLAPFSFFEYFHKSEIGKFLLIKYDNTVIGGIMCPVLRDYAIYEWYVCGLDGEFKNIYPSILATWAAMDYANNNGIPRFDFMGAGSPDKDYGVREFKSKFGGEQVEHGRFIKILNPVLFNVGKTGVKILKKIK